MNKIKRQEVYNKYNCKCAYTGKELDNDWQIDHIIPKNSFIWYQLEKQRIEIWKVDYDLNDIKNLHPAIKIVNHYKRALDLEGFRKYMSEFHLRLKKVPKNPRTEKRIKYKEYMFKVAEMFDITIDKPFNGIFYFETLDNNCI